MSEPLGAQAFADMLDVSRETIARLQVYLDLLAQWQPRINLVGPSTLADPWRRHVLDSAQLARFLPEGAGRLIDLGSGAGFPGAVLAIMSGWATVLIESDKRKATFLREVARQAGAPNITVVAERIEQVELRAEIVTARALAPLTRLLDLAVPKLMPHGRCVFLKGREVEGELTAAHERWTMRHRLAASLSDPQGRVLIIDEVQQSHGSRRDDA